MTETCELSLFLARLAADLRALPRIETIERVQEVHVRASRIEAMADRIEEASERYRPCGPNRKP
jgi:hypothetical protein